MMQIQRFIIVIFLIPLALLLALAPVRPGISASAVIGHLQPTPPADPDPQPLPVDRTSAAGDAPTNPERVVEIVNEERWANGQRPPLKQVDLLDSSAGTHSQNMALRDFFAHCDVDTGDSPWDRMNAAGYTGFGSAGENIAAGYSSPESAMAAWMNSSGHRNNILSTSYREIGVGYDYQSGDQGNIRLDVGNCTAGTPGYGPYYHYWTQNFGTRSGVYPVVINREAHETTSRSVMLYMYGSGWAEEMRFCNASSTWSAWEPYHPDVPWNLPVGNGLKTVLAEIRSGSTVISATDTIYLNEAANHQLETLTEFLHLPLVRYNGLGNPPGPTCTPSN